MPYPPVRSNPRPSTKCCPSRLRRQSRSCRRFAPRLPRHGSRDWIHPAATRTNPTSPDSSTSCPPSLVPSRTSLTACTTRPQDSMRASVPSRGRRRRKRCWASTISTKNRRAARTPARDDVAATDDRRRSTAIGREGDGIAGGTAFTRFESLAPDFAATKINSVARSQRYRINLSDRNATHSQDYGPNRNRRRCWNRHGLAFGDSLGDLASVLITYARVARTSSVPLSQIAALILTSRGMHPLQSSDDWCLRLLDDFRALGGLFAREKSLALEHRPCETQHKAGE